MQFNSFDPPQSRPDSKFRISQRDLYPSSVKDRNIGLVVNSSKDNAIIEIPGIADQFTFTLTIVIAATPNDQARVGILPLKMAIFHNYIDPQTWCGLNPDRFPTYGPVAVPAGLFPTVKGSPDNANVVFKTTMLNNSGLTNDFFVVFGYYYLSENGQIGVTYTVE